ncbi:MAG: hypothetical protein JXR84_04190 [Anaerolineae bacterium]|nr:hypothetical protein [Anaerolineae bacterium]
MNRYGGIRNTCSQCGKKLAGDVAYAENRDDAIAGKGICVDCVSANDAKYASGGFLSVVVAEGGHPEKIVLPEGAVIVDMSDGVDDVEATVSGKALRRRRKAPGGSK